MPYKTKTKFNLVPCPGATPAASAAPPQTVPDPDAAELQRAEQVKREDAAYSKWLEGCQGYYDGCFTCHAFMVDQVYFCADANRDVFGADVIEVELIPDPGAESPAAGKPDIAGCRRHAVQLNMNLSGVRPFQQREKSSPLRRREALS